MGPLLASNNASDVQMMGITFGVAGVTCVVGMVASAMRRVMTTRAREESRREIAAYVAEGSISPDDAAKLLAAGGSIGDQIKDKLRGKMGC